MDRLLLRPAEAAELLSVGRSTIYELLDRGELKGVRIGSSVRIPVEAIRDWLESREASKADRA